MYLSQTSLTHLSAPPSPLVVTRLNITHITKETSWLQSFLKEIWGNAPQMMKICSDNQGAIALAKDNKFHARTKHIDVHYHFIHEKVENRSVHLEYVSSEENVSNIFMKALPSPKFRYFACKLGLNNEHNTSQNQHTPLQHEYKPSLCLRGGVGKEQA